MQYIRRLENKVVLGGNYLFFSRVSVSMGGLGFFCCYYLCSREHFWVQRNKM